MNSFEESVAVVRGRGLLENTLKTERHTTFYLSCGPDGGPLVIFVHGWPDLSYSWRHQMRSLSALGFRVIAPDMRGYGRSSVPSDHAAYAIEHAVQDLLELLDAMGRERAVWVGHDFGAPVVWSLASHHPERCAALACLSIPYIPDGFAVANLVPLVDRALYPIDRFPVGQWDYQLYYEESFDKCRAWFEQHTRGALTALFRRGDPAGQGRPGRGASTRRDGGWFGGARVPPDLPLDTEFMSEADLHVYLSALGRNGFFGPNSWYMNADRNIEFARKRLHGGMLSMPVLYLQATFDYTCMTIGTRLADPMRAHCSDLSVATIRAGHWMAQERPEHVNLELVRWLCAKSIAPST